MNWFTALFSRTLSPKRATKPAAEIPTPGLHKPFLCSKPASVSSQKYPLALLKKLAPLRELDDIYVENLDQQTLSYTPGSILFILGQQRNAIFYLLQGSIEFQPNSNSRYIVTDDSPLAKLPLDCGNFFGATAVAKTQVTILAMSGKIIQMWTNKSREQVYTVKLLDVELPDEIADKRFFNSFSKAYRDNKLSLPSLPHVAVKLKNALLGDIGVKEVVDIIQIDAPIVTKLIQIANSALYAPTSSITNCHDAVSRLGLDATRNLVMGISMKQLFHCKDPKLMKIMQSLWKSSLYVSSLCFVLAEECSGAVNPEDALLAGLISNIGAIPVLHFAEQYPDDYPDLEKLQATMSLLSPSVGALVLHTLGFSDELVHIPMHAEDWLYDSGDGKAHLIDIVILAKLHSYIGSQKAKQLPYINSIPAYAKLKNGKLTPDFSLDVLHKAQQRVHTVMGIFS
ncbi:MAG: HDOD domain-containing protein [Methylovulum sp.]|nr:HDOD domain-containing protein [Methylovulum sp.]